MGRDKKRTVDYFPHECNHGRTMDILEDRFGNDGYAFWFKLLEILGDTDGHYFDYSHDENRMWFASKMNMSEGRCDEILCTLSRLDSIDTELWEQEQIIWSDNFVKNISDVYDKRSSSRPEKPCFRDEKTQDSGESETKTAQRKVKETKGKESKDNKSEVKDSNLPSPTPSEFQKKWNEKLPDIPCHLTDKRKRKLQSRRKEDLFVENWKEILKKISESTFLKENSSSGNGKRTFFGPTWLLKNDDNYVKVLEGYYDDNESNGGGSNGQSGKPGPQSNLQRATG